MPSCFIIMPISTPTELLPVYANDADHFRHVLDHLFIPALHSIDYEPWQPIAEGSDLIHHEIIQQLESADLVMCDMSMLNANVFFELGIRTALNRPVAIVRDNLTTRIPFDLSLINYHTYDSSLTPWALTDEIPRLARHIQTSAEGSEGQNTLWRRFGLRSAGEVPVTTNPVEAKLSLLLDEVSILNRRVWQETTGQTRARTSQGSPLPKIIFDGVGPGIIREMQEDPRTQTLSILASDDISADQVEVIEHRLDRLGWKLELTLDTAEYTPILVEEVFDREDER